MTRINLVPPSELTDQHLFAEYREIRHIVPAFFKSYYSKKYNGDLNKLLKDIPQQYTLGKGHKFFFYDKMRYLYLRYDKLRYELYMRNYKLPNQYPKFFEYELEVGEPIPVILYNDYTPSEYEISINRARIAERIAEKPNFYKYYGKPLLTI